MHSLRHACASLWIESGHNPKQIQKLMGHSSIVPAADVKFLRTSNIDQRGILPRVRIVASPPFIGTYG